ICVDENTDSQVSSFNELLQSGKSLLNSGCDSYGKVEIDPKSLAVLLFTSGTTGLAKAVMLSNRNICSDLMSTCASVDLSYDDSTLCILPLHHAYQAIVMLMVIYIGGSVSFCEGIRHISENLNFYKPTIFVSVPLILEKMRAKIVKKLSEQNGIKKAFTVGKASSLLAKIGSNEVKKRIYSQVHDAFGGNLRMIIVGGAMMSAEVAMDYCAFGFPVIIGYGLTECSPIIICNTSDSPLPDGIGKPVDSAKAFIDRPDENGIGEIVVSGPMVMIGYYNNEEETQKVLREGWFYTGDLGYIDNEQNFHITGRSKNIIIAKNGKNVYPKELEYYLNNEPLVLESLIFADNDEDEVVTAEVVPDEQAIKDELQKDKLSKSDIYQAINSVIKRLNRKLPSYKNIRKIHIRDKEFEKNSSQKIKRTHKKNMNSDEKAD
ncbi:MAG: AMP-binding protein, partial [Ruminococcus sp.]|nr:AMP-binding protein [Ruminococcus sp.]